MITESEQPDPYRTPRTIPARRPYTYLAYGAVFGAVLLTVVISAFMIRSLRESAERMLLRRSSNALHNYDDYIPAVVNESKTSAADLLKSE